MTGEVPVERTFETIPPLIARFAVDTLAKACVAVHVCPRFSSAIVPVLAGIVVVLVPATAGMARVSVPEVAPLIAMLPVKVCNPVQVLGLARLMLKNVTPVVGATINEAPLALTLATVPPALVAVAQAGSVLVLAQTKD